MLESYHSPLYLHATPTDLFCGIHLKSLIRVQTFSYVRNKSQPMGQQIRFIMAAAARLLVLVTYGASPYLTGENGGAAFVLVYICYYGACGSAYALSTKLP